MGPRRVALEFRGEIVTVRADKGDPRYLTATPGAHERGPLWSPDGKKIALADNSWSLWIVDVATGKATKFASERLYAPQTTGSGLDFLFQPLPPYALRLVTASAIPPRIAAADRTSRSVTCSPRRTTPPSAASGGTESWTRAARVVESPRSAAYQIA